MKLGDTYSPKYIPYSYPKSLIDFIRGFISSEIAYKAGFEKSDLPELYNFILLTAAKFAMQRTMNASIITAERPGITIKFNNLGIPTPKIPDNPLMARLRDGPWRITPTFRTTSEMISGMYKKGTLPLVFDSANGFELPFRKSLLEAYAIAPRDPRLKRLLKKICSRQTEAKIRTGEQLTVQSMHNTSTFDANQISLAERLDNMMSSDLEAAYQDNLFHIEQMSRLSALMFLRYGTFHDVHSGQLTAFFSTNQRNPFFRRYVGDTIIETHYHEKKTLTLTPDGQVVVEEGVPAYIPTLINLRKAKKHTQRLLKITSADEIYQPS